MTGPPMTPTRRRHDEARTVSYRHQPGRGRPVLRHGAHGEQGRPSTASPTAPSSQAPGGSPPASTSTWNGRPGNCGSPLYVVDNGRSLREDVKALPNHSGSRNYVDCDDVSEPSRLGSDPLRGWLRCLRNDLSTRSGMAHTVPTASAGGSAPTTTRSGPYAAGYAACWV